MSPLYQAESGVLVAGERVLVGHLSMWRVLWERDPLESWRQGVMSGKTVQTS